MSVIPGHGAAGDAVAKAMAALDGNKTTAPAAEPSATPVTETPPKQEDPGNKAFQVLAKKEKMMYQRARELKERETKMEERAAIIRRHEELETQGKQNPLAILQALGWDYDKLSQFVLNDNKQTPEQIAHEAIRRADALEKKMKDDADKRDSDELAKTKAQQEELTMGFKDEINDVLESASDEFEFILHFGQQELVYETIQENFKKNKKIMDIKEAAKLVEQFLEEEEVTRLTKAKKFQAKFGPKNDDGTPREPQKSSSPASPTLNNQQTISTVSSTLPAKTEQDRIKRALAALDRK